ncbi:MAG: 50S ribosomal protein L32e [Candidatus Hodarchaeota archaeon]
MPNDERRLLRVLEKKKRKNPSFKAHESWRYKRVKSRWRRPRGIDNFQRIGIAGVPPKVHIGYRTPRLVRGRHPSGLEEVIVNNERDLLLINPSKQAARIGGSVGRRKKTAIIEQADIIGIRVLNPLFAEVSVSELEEGLLEEELYEDIEDLEIEDLDFDEEESEEESEEELDADLEELDLEDDSEDT